MKPPKRIKIVKSDPREGQVGIGNLIGGRYRVQTFEKSDNTVTVNAPKYGGLIVLQPSEYQVLA